MLLASQVVLKKLVSSNVTGIQSGSGLVYLQLCVELGHTSYSRDGSKALAKIVAPLRQRGSIFLSFD
ncbi:hypothetical protein CQ10_17520 [Bradyrhizobium valentinum]|nr:hypothetical protein CQ10_17520 [Bradyrhizobium valentinum]